FLPLAVDDQHHGDLGDLHAPAGWRETVERLGVNADDLEPHPHPVALGHDVDDAIAPVRERRSEVLAGSAGFLAVLAQVLEAGALLAEIRGIVRLRERHRALRARN